MVEKPVYEFRGSDFRLGEGFLEYSWRTREGRGAPVVARMIILGIYNVATLGPMILWGLGELGAKKGLERLSREYNS